MFENIKPIESSGEAGDARAAQLQALDDATLEPGAYIEQTSTFAEAEAVQADFVALVDTSLRTVSEGSETMSPVGVDKSIVAGLPGPLPDVAEGAAETPLADTAREAGYEAGPERLDVQLPEQAEPLTGVGNQGNMDASKGIDIGVPLDMPLPEDLVTGGDVGQGSAPDVIGNIPGHQGQTDGTSGMDVNPFGVPDMPTSGGPTSSGSGLPMGGGMGTKASPLDDAVSAAMNAIKVALSPVITDSKEGCSKAADYAVELALYADTPPNPVGKTFISFTCIQVKEDSSHKLSIQSYDITANSLTYDMRPSSKYKEEPDDSNPTPYTGGRMLPPGYTPPSDDDTPRMTFKITNDGMGDVTWKVDPDSPADTGRFYGGIMGGHPPLHPDSGGARPIDPVRDQADASSAASKEDTGTSAETESKE